MPLHRLLVFIGGGAGSLCRYAIGLLLSRHTQSHSFPLATFTANALGCMLIGMLIAHLDRQPHNGLRLLLVTGFCGGFTTFSTFSHETLRLLTTGHHLTAILYMTASLLTALTAVAAGFMLVR